MDDWLDRTIWSLMCQCVLQRTLSPLNIEMIDCKWGAPAKSLWSSMSAHSKSASIYGLLTGSSTMAQKELAVACCMNREHSQLITCWRKQTTMYHPQPLHRHPPHVMYSLKTTILQRHVPGEALRKLISSPPTTTCTSKTERSIRAGICTGLRLWDCKNFGAGILSFLVFCKASTTPLGDRLWQTIPTHFFPTTFSPDCAPKPSY